MSLWTRTLGWFGWPVPEQRRTLQEVDFWLRDDVWGSTTTDAGISVTEATAVAVPSVSAARRAATSTAPQAGRFSARGRLAIRPMPHRGQ
jgi:hypothetical protein